MLSNAHSSGSSSSVLADAAWLDRTLRWLDGALDANLPVLGVCFGHQLLAVGLGGSVETMGRDELGSRPMLHDGDPLFETVGNPFIAFATHSDRVRELPSGSRNIAWNDFGVQGFRHGNRVGVQFHPEYDLPTARLELGNNDSVDTSPWESLLADAVEQGPMGGTEAVAVFENFADMCE